MRFRYRGARPFLTLGPREEWPEWRAWARIRAIQMDIEAGLVVPELEKQLKRRKREMPKQRRPVKDPVGQAYSRLRIAAQMLDQHLTSTQSRDQRLLAREALAQMQAVEEAIVRLLRASYEVEPYGGQNGHD